MLVFDLDPGDGVDITGCAAVALDLRTLLDSAGLQAFPKTSGSKGMQIYVPLNSPHTHGHASDFALAAGQILERRSPTKVTTTMKRSVRGGKVFIDWSQNSRHKTTICAYSLRARPHPTVSTPVSWEEVGASAEGGPLRFEAVDVLDRVAELGDLFAPTLELVQQLPGAPSPPTG